jgi:GNAT superfamily N-acetyltransferase
MRPCENDVGRRLHSGPTSPSWSSPARIDWLHALTEDDEVFSGGFGISVVTGWIGIPEALPAAIEEARRWPEAPGGGEIEPGYAVAPERQGRGTATAVVEELVRRARVVG